jgi:hypothetical protein
MIYFFLVQIKVVEDKMARKDISSEHDGDLFQIRRLMDKGLWSFVLIGALMFLIALSLNFVSELTK